MLPISRDVVIVAVIVAVIVIIFASGTCSPCLFWWRRSTYKVVRNNRNHNQRDERQNCCCSKHVICILARMKHCRQISVTIILGQQPKKKGKKAQQPENVHTVGLRKSCRTAL